jgi:hypothetical protein
MLMVSKLKCNLSLKQFWLKLKSTFLHVLVWFRVFCKVRNIQKKHFKNERYRWTTLHDHTWIAKLQQLITRSTNFHQNKKKMHYDNRLA